MVRPVGYSLSSYGDMIRDCNRMMPYTAALRAAVRPGSIVLDIGAGSGIFSLLACQFGAGHVHAVEPDPAIDVARASALANSYGDRVTFHQTVSMRIILPEKADVIISDLRGVLPLLQFHIASIADARRRLLAPGGVLIPRRDHLWTALIEDPEIYADFANPWTANDYGLDLRSGLPYTINSWQKAKAELKSEQLLTEAQRWATLDYGSIENPNVSGEVCLTARRNGTAHGILVWFDTELFDDIGFSNAPGHPVLIYGRAFFPLEAPVAVIAGDQVTIGLRADLVDDDYIWNWNTEVKSPGAAEPKARLRQSTFFADTLSLDALKRREGGFVPACSEDLQIDRFCLSLVDGVMPLKEIASETARRFPSKFPRVQDALNHVARLVNRYGIESY